MLDVTTSGHVTGSFDLSVTYAAIAYSGAWRAWKDPAASEAVDLDSEAGRELVAMARAVLETRLTHDTALASWFADAGDDDRFLMPAGAFVTLNNTGARVQREGRLRACMGVIEARQPLLDAVVQAAVWATRDPRFPPLAASELDEIEVEVSVLSPMREIESFKLIEVGTHGVLMTKNGQRAVFLPQVAVEEGWNRDTMLEHLSSQSRPAPGRLAPRCDLRGLHRPGLQGAGMTRRWTRRELGALVGGTALARVAGASGGLLGCCRKRGWFARRRCPRMRMIGSRPPPPMHAMASVLKGATGSADGAAAVRRLFNPTDVVGIKLNCLGGSRLSPRPVVVGALVDLLVAGGVARDRVILFERSSRELERAGFPIRRDGPGPRCYGTDNDYDRQASRSRVPSDRVSLGWSRRPAPR